MNEKLATLDDYLRGREIADEDAFEELLFDRAASGTADELSFVSTLSRAMHELRERGIEVWITARDIPKLRAQWGDLLTVIELADDAVVEIPTRCEVVVTRIPLPLEGVERLDVEVETNEGQIIKTMPDVGFDVEDGAVFACCDASLARRTAGFDGISRYVGVGSDGRRRVLRTYNTRTQLQAT